MGKRTSGMDCKSACGAATGEFGPRSCRRQTIDHKKGRLASEPAQSFTPPNSEAQLQAELNQARKVDGVGDLSESRTGLSAVRRPELWMVKDVEELRPELDEHVLCDRGLLEHGEVEVVHTLLPDGSIDPWLVAEGPRIVLY